MTILAHGPSGVKPGRDIDIFGVMRHVRRSDLSYAAQALLMAILDHARFGRGERGCTASIATLAAEINATPRYVTKLMAKLVDDGWVVVKYRRGRGRPLDMGPACIPKRSESVPAPEMPYAEYLQTDHWRGVQARAIKADRYRCRLCNSPDDLNVHHRTYQRLGAERPDDLITLCQGCHAKFHGKMPSE
jgi:hypothetical protein